MALLIKFIALPFYPLGFGITLIAAGIILLQLQRIRIAKASMLSGLIVLYLLSTPLFANQIVRFLEKPFFHDAQLPRDCSAIVVLGGSGVALEPPRIHPEINQAGDRLVHAAWLYSQGYAPRIITSGGTVVGAFKKSVPEGVHNALFLRNIGIDSASIIIEAKAKNTADHGPLIAQILDSLHLAKRIILVTSATHMSRSVALFKKSGYTVYPSAADFNAMLRSFNEVKDILPSANALASTTTALHELYGMAGYWILGWL